MMEHPDSTPVPHVPIARPVDLSALGPSSPRERIVAMDVLRGFALLGILLMNIRSFAMIYAVYFNPLAAGPLSRVDLAVWWLGDVLANSKFMTIFSMLFGAGIVLLSQRREQAHLPAARIHYRRMLGLWIIGMIHAYFIWNGDILVTYALCGCVVYLMRRWRPTWLFVLGGVLLLIGDGINWLWYISLPYWPADAVRELRELMLQPPPAAIEAEIRIYRGPWLGQLVDRAATSFAGQTYVFLIWGCWRAAGLMLVGVGLFRTGVLTGRADRRVYLALLASAVLVGLPLILAGMWWYPANTRGTLEAFFRGSLPNYWGSIPLSLLCRRLSRASLSPGSGQR